LIYGKNVIIKNISNDKYGRVLCDVFYENIHINQWLLDNNYAIKYNGGTKINSDEWEGELNK
jgi:endonuclease YncB( thermonuclease family)